LLQSFLRPTQQFAWDCYHSAREIGLKPLEAVTLSVAEDAYAAEKVLQQLIDAPGKSGSILLKDPAASTQSSWHLWLPAHFNSALDLRFLQKQKTKNKEIVQTWKEWVQGSRFQFTEGSIIYNRDVSAIRTWGEKLRAIDFYVEINSSSPVSLKTEKDEKTGFRIVRRNPGLVSFAIYASGPDSSEDVSREISMTQDEFVRFAITGKR
jgi:hypothetical protein